MLQKPLVLLKNTTNKFKSTRGDLLPFLFVVFVGFIWLVFLKFDTDDRMITHQVVQDTIYECLSSATADNLHESYQPFRSANTGAYVYNGTSFVEIQNTTLFLERLANDFRTKVENNTVTSTASDGTLDFKLSNIRLFVKNAKAEYLVKYDITVPSKLGETRLQTTKKQLVVKYQKIY